MANSSDERDKMNEAINPATHPEAYNQPMATVGGPEDYFTYDFTNSPAALAYKQQQDAAVNLYTQQAQQVAGQQALANVHGIGGQYGLMGAANSGAARAAAAQGAAQPFAQAATQEAAMRAQGLNQFYDMFSGVGQKSYQPGMSQAEKQAAYKQGKES